MDTFNINEITYGVKIICVILGIWLAAAGITGCGIKVGENTMLGTPEFAKTVYHGELQLRKQRK